jgi:hypothetical protein
MGPRQLRSSAEWWHRAGAGAAAGGVGEPAGPHESCWMMLQDVFVKNLCTTACKVSDQYVASFTLSLTRCTAPCHTRSPRSPRLPCLPRSHRCFPTFWHMFRSVSGLSASALHYGVPPSSRSRAGRRLHRRCYTDIILAVSLAVCCLIFCLLVSVWLACSRRVSVCCCSLQACAQVLHLTHAAGDWL